MNFQKHHTQQAHIKLGVKVQPHVKWDAQLPVLSGPWASWPFSFSDEWALPPGPTFTGGFIHHSILCLTGRKHSGGAQGTFWCDGCVMVTVFPMIWHLFQVTLIKKTHLVWHLKKLKLLLIECIKSIYILENERFPYKAQRKIVTTELSCVTSLEVLYLLLKVYAFPTHLPHKQPLIFCNNLQ